MLRVGIIGGGPARSFFALYARLASQQAMTIYECKASVDPARPVATCAPSDPCPRHASARRTRPGAPGRIRHYALHTWAGTIEATPPDASAEVFGVYRGAGPCGAPRDDLLSFDQFLLDQAVARGAVLRRSRVEAARRLEGSNAAPVRRLPGRLPGPRAMASHRCSSVAPSALHQAG